MSSREGLRNRLTTWTGAVSTPLAIVAALATVALLSPGSAGATMPAPAWSVRSVAMPTHVSPSSGGNIVVLVTNNGAQPTDGGTVTVRDTVPVGLAVTEASGHESPHEKGMKCEHTSSTVTCTYPEESEAELGALRGDSTDGLAITITVTVEAGVLGTLTNTATVSGGGAPQVSSNSQVTISSQAPPFDLSNFNFGVSNAEGAPDTQAGDHPNALTVGFDVNSVASPTGLGGMQTVQPVKSVTVELPLGLIGNPQAAERCPQYDLALNESGIHCPLASIVGSVAFSGESLGYLISSPGEEGANISPLFSVVPEHGYPAEFAFVYLNNAAFMYASVAHTSSGYVLRTTAPALPTIEAIKDVQLTFFGDPAVQDGEATLPKAFFTNPVDCSRSAAAPTATIKVNSWAEPTNVIEKTATLPTTTGCNRLQFEPKIEVKPQNTQVDSPTGLTFNLNIPQNEAPSGLATPELKDATVTLPRGVSVSPPSADGLAGCPATGPEGINLYAEEPGADGQEHLVPGHCPQASQIGTVKVTTPLLASPLEGHVYLAQPKCGGEGQAPCTEADATNGNLFPLYIEVEGSGVNIKLSGTVSANPTTGQLTTTFKENPQLPFSDLELTLNGGPHAPLANPQSCGEARTTTDLVPWSAPATPDATPTSFFNVDLNGAGGGCPSSMPFAPSFSAGTVTPNAAASSPFTLTFSRHDGEQDLSGISVATPPGLVGMLSQVPLCEELQAAAGTCPETSRIGTTTVAAGAGSHPFWIAGKVYLTGPYNGAPFGLSVVVPAKAGPFNLGNVVVRAAINVNPTSTALTITSGPLPQIKDGVPFRLQTVNVTIDRPGFMLNPTNCEQQSIKGTIAAAQGATASVSSPFAVGGCASLPFKPSFTAATQAKTSKANGASLDVKVSYPPSGDANIKSVKVDLPKQLPSRLTTLQKACPAAVFEANPAKCPPESIVGIAKAQTPVLPVTLTGPAYLVSHAAAAFPDLVVILQGEGVRVDLTGNTLIKKGVTSSTFASIPDVPVSSFELYLPEGKYSALAAYANLCTEKLQMPTAIMGQNGAEIHESTRVEVKGCPNAVSIQSHSIRKRTLTVSVYVPSAGKLSASGKGLSKTSKSSTGPETLKLTLKTTKGGRLTARIKLTFSPKKGTKQAKSFSVRFG
jgi:hypothetical protein